MAESQRSTPHVSETRHDILTRLAGIYNNGNSLTVEYGPKPHAKQDGETIVVNPDIADNYDLDAFIESTQRVTTQDREVQSMRLVVDTLAHEAYHVLLSDLLSKEQFTEDNPEYSEVAGALINVLEDTYVDARRCEKYRGMNDTLAFKIAVYLAHQTPVDSDALTVSQSMLEAFESVAFGGYADGLRDAPGETQAFVGAVLPVINDYRDEADRSRRYQLAQHAYDLFLEFAPDPETADEYADENDKGAADGEMDGDPVNDSASDVEANPQGGDAGLTGSVGTNDSDRDNDSDNANDKDGGGDAGDIDATREIAKVLAASDNPTQSISDRYDVDGSVDIFQPSHADRQRAEEVAYADADPSDAEADAQEDGGDESGDGESHARVDDWVGDNDLEMQEREFENEAERIMEDRGLVSEIVEAFEEFTNRDHPHPSRVGFRPHMRNLVRLRSGDPSVTELAYRRELTETGDRLVVCVPDFSSSVDDTLVKIAVASVAVATMTIGDDFVCTAFSTDFPGHTKRLTDTGEEFHFSHLNRAFTGGSTPTAAGIADAVSLANESGATEKVILVITDGKANKSLGGGAVADAADQTKRFGDDTVVIGFGVDDVSEAMMADIFGSDGYVMVGMDGLADALVDVYLENLDIVRRGLV